jgi:hypothetical protein
MRPKRKLRATQIRTHFGKGGGEGGTSWLKPRNPRRMSADLV